jgi:hypothetical protein
MYYGWPPTKTLRVHSTKFIVCAIMALVHYIFRIRCIAPSISVNTRYSAGIILQCRKDACTFCVCRQSTRRLLATKCNDAICADYVLRALFWSTCTTVQQGTLPMLLAIQNHQPLPVRTTS